MKDNQKDNRVTNNQDNQQGKENKPNLDNATYPSQQPATDAEDTGSKAQKEYQDTDHPHTYNTPMDDKNCPAENKSVVSEISQNSNPGNVHNSEQGANQQN